VLIPGRVSNLAIDLSPQASLTESATLAGSEREDGRPETALSPVKARMLLIVNPRATTVSGRLRKLIEYALRGRYELEAVETEGPNHATELTRGGAEDGYDIVVAFGGDGTVNEAANGLAGSRVPLAILPGGCTNVVCRMLGVPTDIVDATERLLTLAGAPRTRAIDLGSVNERYFVSSAGFGMDAETTRWVDDRPRIKAHAGPLSFSVAGAATYLAKYLHSPPRIAFEANGDRVEGVSAVIQNSDPYTYFNDRPVRICDGAQLDCGTFSACVLKRARQRDLPGLTWRLLSGRSALARHPQAVAFEGLHDARVTAVSSGGWGALPVQVDGDYIGDFAETRVGIHPASLLLVT
jgi:diacylglycerol kinase family enzyme